MSRTTYIYDADLDCMRPKYGGNYFEERKESGPAVISDDLKSGINGLRNHADGRIYDSKSRYTKAVRRAGCEIVGNESPEVKSRELIGRREIGETVKRSFEELSSGNREALDRHNRTMERRDGR